jgi:23S rRNA (uracil1939-C5)-methyltransferase
MAKKTLPIVTVTLDKIVGGGQALGTLEDGRKLFVWGGLPGETVDVQLTRKKSHYVEGVVTKIHTKSSQRIEPQDPESYLSTSPWQIMNFDAEQHYKAALIEEAFELHDIVLPEPITVFTDGQEYHYRNKVEFSWYGDGDPGNETLHLAFFRRGSKGKIIIDECALLPPHILNLAHSIRDTLQKASVTARLLKTLLIRCDREGNCVWQLYVKDTPCYFADILTKSDFAAQGGEIIYSNPKSPASIITERLVSVGNVTLSDSVLGVPFRYATEGFFQINLPVYEQALRDMKGWIPPDKPTVDLYSGVGSIGLTIGGPGTILVELNEHAVREMKRNIADLKADATPVLAASEQALEYISHDKTIIVDPPRAGLHSDVIKKLLETHPQRIIYLSCNPVTQARDTALLAEKYGIRSHRGYNFFPRTPHIEHLVVLDAK